MGVMTMAIRLAEYRSRTPNVAPLQPFLAIMLIRLIITPSPTR